ncbi:hypothetical protein [Paraburkholderia rhynchosiae]|uniref:Uncharacterized protein n=1 Tax=Paraburkholderia rhynchosiae TaxID=487049 RepID=A0ABX4UZL9_9BURK|nr:hypothetical protein [Paraburkholderia rhynchosiae]PMS27379.1 hypothetical protein C0Z16_25510 [Paraburkholderia rhynchosiae]
MGSEDQWRGVKPEAKPLKRSVTCMPERAAVSGEATRLPRLARSRDAVRGWIAALGRPVRLPMLRAGYC